MVLQLPHVESGSDHGSRLSGLSGRLCCTGCHAKDNRDLIAAKGKLRIPVLVAVGATSPTAPLVRGTMEEVSGEAKILPIAGAEHWIAEERPEAFAAGLIDFLGPHR